MSTAAAPMCKEVEPRSRERIDVRLRPEQKAEIVTDFIIQNAVANARQAIREYETWILERPDAEIFAAALLGANPLGPQLTRAAQRYKERFQQK